MILACGLYLLNDTLVQAPAAPVPLWQTEHYFGASSDVSITNGLAVAEQIHDFMTVAEASAYHYWWLKGSGSGSIATI